jgi:hypothetical protein
LLLAFGHVDAEAWSGQSLRRPALARFVVVGAALAAVCLGLPLRLLLTAAFCEVTPRAELMNQVAAQVHPDDVVFSEYATFFEAKRVTPQVYVPFSARGLGPISRAGLDLTPEQREHVSVMIVSPGQKDPTARYFGGDWVAVSDPFGDSVALGKWSRVPVLGRWLQTLFSHAPGARFKLQIFRRVRSGSSADIAVTGPVTRPGA